ncbi:hypothetical protein EDD75_0384 [Thermodesulfitimonas autotrophica]|uniref:Uncharacterized protein n=1 Tax=Thermodesulfitimonas autotrophica TaxID=1894989 RepID=A0A3N5AXA6_9THEO|nr:hypothetical protein [Thermodesulfitimonas autotrophica]RPF49567.1 hypothetical protein EDD75_0384 [Thermodesulfitimonas autotrophica]
MEIGLSLASVIFLLYVLLPGGVVLTVAGRREKDVTLARMVFYGTWVFAVALLLCWGVETASDFRLYTGFTASLAKFSQGEGLLDVRPLAPVFLIVYALACFIGFAELWSKVGVFPSGYWLRVKRLYWKVARQKPFAARWVKVGNLPGDVFLAYRKAGKRPYIKGTLKDGTAVQGECLRYSWNGSESVLLRDADRPDSLIWVRLDDFVRLEFANIPTAETAGASFEETWRWRKVLNGIVPGLGEEFFSGGM